MHNSDTISSSSQLFAKLLEIIIKLRSPEGCPWDKEQTLKSLIPNIFEETYECIDAIDARDFENVMEEIGDLYFLIIMLSYILEQTSIYKITDILEKITTKLIRRHPHVFSDIKVNSVDEVLDLWQNIKLNLEGRKEKDSILDSIPISSSSIERAYKIQKKVAKVGFEWINSKDVLNKIKEELFELEEELNSGNKNKAEVEMGDFIFSAINLSRFLGIDPNIALHKTNQKFTKRFKYVESRIKKMGKDLKESTLEEMNIFWDDSKEFDVY